MFLSVVYDFWSALWIFVLAVFSVFLYWIEKAKTPSTFQEVNSMGVSDLVRTKLSFKMLTLSSTHNQDQFWKFQILEIHCIHLKGLVS